MINIIEAKPLSPKTIPQSHLPRQGMMLTHVERAKDGIFTPIDTTPEPDLSTAAILIER